MEIIKIDLENLNQEVIRKAAHVIQDGGVVIAPTDTIYGLICDARNEAAVRRIYEIKKQDFSKPIGIFAGDIKMARKYAKIKKDQEKWLKTNDTFIFPIRKILPFQKKTLGIRIPYSDLILAIIGILNFPLAQTSANLSGKFLGNDIEKIIQTFKNQDMEPDLILDAGKLPERKASKVVDLTGDEMKIIRK